LIGSSALGNVTFTGAGAKTFSANASTTDFTIMPGSGTVTAPALLTVTGNYSNLGTFTNSSGIIYATSSAAQTFSGVATGTSALANVIFLGSGTKNISSNASTTDFTITTTSGAVTAPTQMSVFGNFLNNGTFTSSNVAGANLYFASTTGTQTIFGNATGTSALGTTTFVGAGAKVF